jgi:hypothetical protein
MFLHVMPLYLAAQEKGYFLKTTVKMNGRVDVTETHTSCKESNKVCVQRDSFSSVDSLPQSTSYNFTYYKQAPYL